MEKLQAKIDVQAVTFLRAWKPNHPALSHVGQSYRPLGLTIWRVLYFFDILLREYKLTQIADPWTLTTTATIVSLLTYVQTVKQV